MRELLARYRRIFALLACLALPIVSVYFHGKHRTGHTLIEGALLRLTGPIQSGMRNTVDGVRGLLSDYLYLVDVKRENDRLTKEHEVLLGEALKARALRADLARLKETCDYREASRNLSTTVARVVMRDTTANFRVLRVVLETATPGEVREGQAVITPAGVVGQIFRVEGSTAEVMLATDARSQIAATIVGKGVTGTVHGKGHKNEFGARFVYLERADRSGRIEREDVVVTTGHDRIFPAGLEIGSISSDDTRQTGLYHEFDLRPAVAFATLEEVLVVRSSSEPESKLLAPMGDKVKPQKVDAANRPD
jgi:rod shape-determining protein MreC